MPPLIFNVGLFLGRHYWGDVKGLFCVSVNILYAKAFSGFSMDFSSSLQVEDIGFINSGGDCWHKQA